MPECERLTSSTMYHEAVEHDVAQARGRGDKFVGNFPLRIYTCDPARVASSGEDPRAMRNTDEFGAGEAVGVYVLVAVREVIVERRLA